MKVEKSLSRQHPQNGQWPQSWRTTEPLESSGEEWADTTVWCRWGSAPLQPCTRPPKSP